MESLQLSLEITSTESPPFASRSHSLLHADELAIPQEEPRRARHLQPHTGQSQRQDHLGYRRDEKNGPLPAKELSPTGRTRKWRDINFIPPSGADYLTQMIDAN